MFARRMPLPLACLAMGGVHSFKCRTKGQAGYRMSEEEEHHETSVFERVEDGRWLFRDTLQRKQER